MLNKNTIPREEGMDKTLSLMREGYMYISNRCHSFQSDIFETRLFGKKAICMRGKEVAELFYDNDKFKRKEAIPKRVVQSFFGEKDRKSTRLNSSHVATSYAVFCLNTKID